MMPSSSADYPEMAPAVMATMMVTVVMPADVTVNEVDDLLMSVWC
jgi:hypothetical protein